MIRHPFPPLYDENSKILILGSFPSVKSREQLFFFTVIPRTGSGKSPLQYSESKRPILSRRKKDFLLSCNIALWDVIASCDIQGSSDSSIRDVTANDLSPILSNSKVERIFTNGKTADKFYKKYTFKTTGIQATCLPSTSPANAAWSVEKLMEAWKIICTDS